MLVELREDEVGADLAAAAHHRGGGLVAGGLDSQDRQCRRNGEVVGRASHGAGPYALAAGLATPRAAASQWFDSRRACSNPKRHDRKTASAPRQDRKSTRLNYSH